MRVGSPDGREISRGMDETAHDEHGRGIDVEGQDEVRSAVIVAKQVAERVQHLQAREMQVDGERWIVEEAGIEVDVSRGRIDHAKGHAQGHGLFEDAGQAPCEMEQA